MSTRPLRLHYDSDVVLAVDDDLGAVVGPWRAHRQRLLGVLEALDDDSWLAPTRCDAWNARDLVGHLITVDGFWVASLDAARRGDPTRFLPGFDPSATPELLVAPMRALPAAELLQSFAAGQETFLATVESFAPEEWAAPAESPMGHVSARLALAHAFWDSWVHEADLALTSVPPGSDDPDELFTVAWYSLFVTAVQGGLVDDEAPVGPGLTGAIDVEIGFDELAGRAVRVQVDRDVRLSAGREPAAVVSAVALVDACTGRTDGSGTLEQLPEDLRAHLERGREILAPGDG